MIPVGYMAKRIAAQIPEWLSAPAVRDIYSVSSCVNSDLAEEVPRWKLNSHGLFNSREEMRSIANSEGLDLQGMRVFYYEASEREFDGEEWLPIEAESGYETRVQVPAEKSLEGFDVVTFCDGPNSHSPLSCNSVAAEVATNGHCLFQTKEEAEASLTSQVFADSEPGPFRIYAIYSTDWD
jgi:hypothetical protein